MKRRQSPSKTQPEKTAGLDAASSDSSSGLSLDASAVSRSVLARERAAGMAHTGGHGEPLALIRRTRRQDALRKTKRNGALERQVGSGGLSAVNESSASRLLVLIASF